MSKKTKKKKKSMSNSIRRASCAHTTDRPNVYWWRMIFQSEVIRDEFSGDRRPADANRLANENDDHIVYM